jgi:hypothetical protein
MKTNENQVTRIDNSANLQSCDYSIDALDTLMAEMPDGSDVELPSNLSQMSGEELGQAAHSARIKTARSLIAFSVYVHQAYSRYYEPWKKVGRKSAEQTKDAEVSNRHWQDFLKHLGWSDFPRYQRVIRQFASIGAKAEILEPHASDLPNTVDALSAVCHPDNSDAQIELIAKECSRDTTGADAKRLVDKVRQTMAKELSCSHPSYQNDFAFESGESNGFEEESVAELRVFYNPKLIAVTDRKRVEQAIETLIACGFELVADPVESDDSVEEAA